MVQNLRNGLKFGVMVGEASKVDKLIWEDWKNKLNELTSGYKVKDIFNGDELGLFWKLTPNQTYFLPGELRKSINNNKEMCTLFIKRNGLKFRVMVREESKVDKLICEDWKNKLNELSSDTMLKIYLTEKKLGLFWKLTLN